MAVSFDPKQETNHFGTSNLVFSSVEIRAIISFKVISWYYVTFSLSLELTVLYYPRPESSKYTETFSNCSLVYSCAVDDVVNRRIQKTYGKPEHFKTWAVHFPIQHDKKTGMQHATSGKSGPEAAL